MIRDFGLCRLEIAAKGGFIVRVAPSEEPERGGTEPEEKCALELAEYFSGSRRSFDIPLSPAGTEFQRRVWAECARVPFGATASYSELARRIGSPGAARAVGAALNRNPALILVPCHRIVASNGNLTGFRWGIGLKRALLSLESAYNGMI